MNTDQFQSLIRSGMKVFATWLALHGYAQFGNALNTPDVIALIILAASFIWSHFSHAGSDSASSSVSGRTSGMIAMIAIGASLYAGPCHAQPVTVQGVAPVTLPADLPQFGSVSNVPNFFNDAYTWGTSFNTNYSWTPIKIQIEDGYKQATGSGASDYLRIQYDIGKFNVGIEGEFLGYGSQFTAVELEFGYTLFSKYDFKIESNLLAGYDRGMRAAEIEPELKMTKLITANTYMTAGYSMPWFSKGTFNSSGQFRVGAGFTF
jgi:hypothetical protein